ncbi:MAG: ferrous iron transport protein B [bacterium]
MTTKNLTVALAGNPNSGKTSVFNNLTGARQHVGNWPGVTVERKEGFLHTDGVRIRVVDLPGTYSLTAYSLDEIIARNFVVRENPDVVVDIVDASNLERNLYLAVQMIELGANLVIALNMTDVAEAKGLRINVGLLSELLGVPVVSTVATKGRGMAEIVGAVLEAAGGKGRGRKVRVYYGSEVEDEVGRLVALINGTGVLVRDYDPRWLALKLLERDRQVAGEVAEAPGGAEVLAEAAKSASHLKTVTGEDPETILADSRYGFINGLLKEVVAKSVIDRRSLSDTIDAVVLNRALGLPIFIGLMWLIFQLTFRLGAAPMEWIDAAFVWTGNALGSLLGGSLFASLLVDGVIGGVGGVLVFLPNILLLFFAIALLEDTGYMARAAFIMDRVMHLIGLHGKSFIPMLVGFGCNVPAIMATRTLESQRDRLVTILIIPLMSCGARLPVYVLLAGAFFRPETAGHVIFSLYIIGAASAILMARLFRAFLLPGPSTPFVMELPPYKAPTLKSVLIHMWERGWLYLKKAGTILLAIAVVMWFLTAVPRGFPGREGLESRLEKANARFETAAAEAGLKEGTVEYDALYGPVAALKNEIAAGQLRHSIAGRLGAAIEPVFRPLGFDWKADVALVAAFAAKEVVVSTLGTIYSVGEADETSAGLRAEIADDPVFNPLVAYVLMLFTLLTVPCMATVAVIRRETNSWKWPLFSIAYQSALAWLVCFAVFQLGSAAGVGTG